MSTTLAGYAMDHFGGRFTFALLASVAACGLGLVWLMLPETRPEPTVPRQRAPAGRLRRSALSEPPVGRINRLRSSGRELCQWTRIGPRAPTPS
jgi:hypothetical protein